MSTKYVAEGDVFQFVAGATITSGQPVLLTDMLGIAVTDVANGATGSAMVEGVHTIAKVPTDVITQGQILYWNAGASQVTTTVGTNKRAGRAYAAAGNGITTVPVLLTQGA